MQQRTAAEFGIHAESPKTWSNAPAFGKLKLMQSRFQSQHAATAVRTRWTRWLENHQMEQNWPFADPPNVVSFALRQIMDGDKPILLVSHDSDEGMWQFLDGDAVSMDDAMLVLLKNVVALDPTVAELADLPIGWQASRRTVDDPWQRQPES